LAAAGVHLRPWRARDFSAAIRRDRDAARKRVAREHGRHHRDLQGDDQLHIFISNRLGDSVAGATGRPVTGYEARIVDDDMTELPDGTVGHLAVRGPTGCRYLGD